MEIKIALGMIIPFLGTLIGSALVFILRKEPSVLIKKILIGFAAGVMVAASIWSLIIPGIEKVSMGKFSFIPVLVGLWLGVILLLIIDRRLFKNENTDMLFFAVTLHNIPEGMAVGVVLSGVYFGNNILTLGSALVLCLGIAFQNLPEGAIISAPLFTEGKTKVRSFLYGILSGVVEPIASLITFFIAGLVQSILPYVLGFAAGAMLYVVIDELVPNQEDNRYKNIKTISFFLGFSLMMVLDVALG